MSAPRPRLWLAAAVPVAGVVLAVGLERWLLGEMGPHKSLMDQVAAKEVDLDALKKVMDLNGELAKWFIGLATSVLAGVMYYIRAKAGEQAQPTLFSRVTSAGAVAFSVVSIFFGHLWQAAMRDQLAVGYFAPQSRALIWPERVQYLCFVAGLCWFGLLILERELGRPVAEAKPKPGEEAR